MSKLVIRKRVNFGFLGQEYKDSYIDFKSIPIADYDELVKKLDTLKDHEANFEILSLLKKYYIVGKFPNEKGELDELDDVSELDAFDADCLLECFGKLTGQDLRTGDIADPNSDTPSKPGLTAENPDQEKLND